MRIAYGKLQWFLCFRKPTIGQQVAVIPQEQVNAQHVVGAAETFAGVAKAPPPHISADETRSQNL